MIRLGNTTTKAVRRYMTLVHSLKALLFAIKFHLPHDVKLEDSNTGCTSDEEV